MSNEDPVDGGGEYIAEPQESAHRDIDPGLRNIQLSLDKDKDDDGDDFVEGGLRARGFVDVIAELADPDAAVDGLTVVQKIGQIVTGTLDINKIESVSGHPNVIRLELARKLFPTLDRSVYEVRAHQEQIREGLPAGATPFDGAGVIVGVVDYDCDFAHANFCVRGDPSPRTRILFLWDQRIQPAGRPPECFPYGREFSTAEINDALTHLPRPGPYVRLNYRPAGSHGTHVLDIAAGNGNGTRNEGVAPNADIIFVHLATEKASEIGNLGNSRRLIDAVKYIFDKADALRKPAVVNISVSARVGPHDGSSLVDKAFEELLRTPERAIVVGAGNWRTTGGHASGTLKPGQTRRLQWLIRARDETPNEMEIWYGGEHEIEMHLRSPGGQLIGPFPLGTDTPICRDGVEVARIIHGDSYTDNGDHVINLFFGAEMETGSWEVRLRPAGASTASFHAWIAGDQQGQGQSRFGPGDVNPACTLGTIACGKSTIVVGAYDPLKPHPASASSSVGPTRDGRLKPEVSAPGESINVARPLFDEPTVTESGTSLSAPHVAGAIALLLEALRRDEFRRFADDIRAAAISSARKGPPHGPDWNPRYGYGRFNALSTILLCLQGTSRETL